jgi:hypothetical protein
MASAQVGFALLYLPKRASVFITGSWIVECRNGYQVTLFESEAKCGGHTLTDDTSPWPVDLGFQVRPIRLCTAMNISAALSACTSLATRPRCVDIVEAVNLSAVVVGTESETTGAVDAFG